jgi:hypothetical protein
VQLKITNTTTGSVTGRGIWSGAPPPPLPGETAWWGGTTSFYSGQVTIGPGATETVTITTPAMPDHVTKAQLAVTFGFTSMPGGPPVPPPASGSLSSSTTHLYLTMDQPNADMQVAWTEVLDWACVWAHGLKDPVPIASAVTERLFDALLFVYNLHETGIPSKWLDWDGDGKFLLTQFVGSPVIRAGNCVDVSYFNALCLSALGLPDIELNRQLVPGGFVTWPVCPIGSDRFEGSSYQALPFVFHQQVHIDDHVFDAALSFVFDPDGFFHFSPAVNWPELAYWSNHPDPWGLAKRYWDSNFDYAWDSGEFSYWYINPLVPPEPVSFSSSSFSFKGVK